MDKTCLKKNYADLMRADKEVNVCYDAIRTQEETAIRKMESSIKTILETQENKELPLIVKGSDDICTQVFGMVAEGENITLTKLSLETNSKGETFVIVKGTNDDIGADYEDMFNHLDMLACGEVWIAVKGVMGSMMLEENLL